MNVRPATPTTADTTPAVTLFEGGTPEEDGAALATYREATRALGAGSTLRWFVDPANLGLLSRAARELATYAGATPIHIDVILRAEDRAFDETHVAHEGALVPTLRRLRDQGDGAELRLLMSNGRPYLLPPPALDISTNDLCGLECNMCNNRATKRDPNTISPDHVQALIRDAASWGIRRVALTGAGEPFRDPKMLEHIRFANELGHLVTITTNGFPISDKIAAELAERTVSVSVSIHGATEATHEKIVGVPKGGDNAWRAIRRLVQARKERSGSTTLSVNISTVIQRENLEEIPALVRRAKAEGVQGVNIQPINLQHGQLRGDDIIRRDDVLLMGRLWPLSAERDRLEAMFDELDALKAEHGKFIHATADRLRLFRRYFREPSPHALGVACRVGDSFLAVDHRGRIKPCYRLPWSHGDARVVNLRTLWNSRAYAKTRAQIDTCPLTCMNNCFFREARPTKDAAS